MNESTLTHWERPDAPGKAACGNAMGEHSRYAHTLVQDGEKLDNASTGRVCCYCLTAYRNAKHDKAIVATATAELQKENMALRRLLFFGHSCGLGALYGDDGEMQCNACHIDFKRMPTADIEQRLHERGLKRLAELQLRTESTP